MTASKQNLKFECNIEETDLVGEGAFGKVRMFYFLNLRQFFLIYLFQVYKVYLKNTGETVAVKETKGAFALDPITHDFNNLNTEIQILKQLNHKNIIRYSAF